MLSRTMKQASFASSIVQGGGKRRAEGMEPTLRWSGTERTDRPLLSLLVPLDRSLTSPKWIVVLKATL